MGGQAFSGTRAHLVARLGSPQRESQNAVGLYELDYGTIVIRGTGSGLEGLRYIAKPLELRSAIIAK